MIATRRQVASCASTAILLLGMSCAGAPERIWIPSDSDLAFTSNRDGNREIFVLRAGSPAWQNLTNSDAAENWPQWSPDGNLIAYQSNLGGNLNIWVMRSDGSRPKQLTEHLADDAMPAWSPNGKQLTFCSWRQEPGDQHAAAHVYVMNADGTDQRRLISTELATAVAATWAPDGKSLLIAQTNDSGTDIYHYDERGKLLAKLTDDKVQNGAPEFSPDGTKIAFHSDNGSTSDLVIMNRDGSNRRSVRTGGKFYFPHWSADGRWLVFTDSGSESNVLAMRAADDAEPLRLVGGRAREAEGHWRRPRKTLAR
jgi:TolB protein